MTLDRFYLLFSGIGLSTIGMSYGISPSNVLPAMLDITIDGTDQTHIFRAVMCLYFGMSLYWLVAAFTPNWSRHAIISVVFFMAGLAIGRLLSLAIDGVPSLLLVIYMFLEFAMLFFGLYVLKASSAVSSTTTEP
jgi:Domain of unknown function (DUF4345)